MTAPREHADDKTGQSLADVLPCPFCGSTEGFYVVKGSTFSWRAITCRSCGEGTEVRHKNYSDEPDSYIADWNAAAPYPAMLRKELDTLRAQLAEAQRDAEVNKQINRACMELPDDFRIAIELERNAACVYLLQEDEDIGSYDPCDGIASSISAAIDAARGEQ